MQWMLPQRAVPTMKWEDLKARWLLFARRLNIQRKKFQ